MGRVVLGFVLLLALSAGCEWDDEVRPPTGEGRGSPTSEAYPLSVEDDEGRVLRLEAAPERIVSLVPSSTEILRSLGARDRLVARTDFDTAQDLRPLPSVGGGLHPSLEVLASLDPDLVVRFAGPSDRRTPQRLDDLEIPHFAVRPDGIQDIFRIIGNLGRILDRAAPATELETEIQEELEEVSRAVAGAPRVRTAFVLEGTPPWVAGEGTFIHELIEAAGGANAFSDLGSLYASVSREELLTREIDVILLPPGVRLDLLPEGVRVERVSGQVQSPGPRLGDAAREVAEALHPGSFP